MDGRKGPRCSGRIASEVERGDVAARSPWSDNLILEIVFGEWYPKATTVTSTAQVDGANLKTCALERHSFDQRD